MTVSDSSYTSIVNLLHRYAELVDQGRFSQMADELFVRTAFKVAPPPAPLVGSREIRERFEQMVIVHGDGTPRTRHLVTNPIVDIDEGANTAASRSCYTVLQQTEDLPLQVILAGRYHDRFVRAEGVWWFSERDYTLVDLTGNVSHHLRLLGGQDISSGDWS